MMPALNAAVLLLAVLLPVTSQAAVFIGVASDRDGQVLPNAVVALKPIGQPAPPSAPATITVTQEGLSFKPYVSVVRSGSRVVFANRDTVEHHIKSFSSIKPFEIAVHRPGDTPPPIQFDKEGAIIAYCILHDWMRAYVFVADTPWAAVAGESGFARIEGVPPGDYELLAWHPDLGQFKAPLSSRVMVGATGTTQTTIRFDFKPRPIRRAPKTADGKVAAAHLHH
ncbi:MAG: methylamine utilization protein [Burkholderiales bacterium]|nr:methylamine utilization protein [Burkholderiales bacterium]